jgi:hypothetical protein
LYYNSIAVMKTIFYSWQSDLPSDINKSFIESCVESAIKKLKDEYNIDSSPRNDEFKLDKDIQDTPGSPSIPDTIFKKIDMCTLFIADLTFVGKTAENPETKKIKTVPNPNVLIEYGYATKSKSEKRIIAVMNTEFGEPTDESMPFNIRHKKWPIQYKLGSYDESGKKTEVENALVESLYQNISVILKGEPTSQGTLEVALVKGNSKYYISHDSKKIFILPCLKIKNLDKENVSVSIEDLEVQISGNWVEADKSNFRGGMIVTKRGSVTIHPDEFIDKHEDIRIEGFDSKVIIDAFELSIKAYKDDFLHQEPIKVKVYVKSLDGRNANIEDEIASY